MARALDAINSNNQMRWHPSDEDLLALRRMSRKGYTTAEAYAVMSPPITLSAFAMRTREKFGVLFETTGRNSRAYRGRPT